MSDEIITEQEWHNRMMVTCIYNVIFIDWESGITRVLNKFNGEIHDVTAEKIGNKMVLRLKKLE